MTKVDIISGFLGAGKTTLISKLLKEALKGEQVVLIENEFGEIGIDGGFLKDSGVEIREMNSGCICCSLVGDFGTSLKEVVDKYHPDRIIIEPSGVGKLSDVIKAVKDLHIENEIVLNSASTVADASKVKVYMKNFGEFFNNQIEHAGTVILSRTQNVSEEKLKTAIELIKSVNPNAHIITTPWDDIDGTKILGAMENVTNLELDMLAEAAQKVLDRSGFHKEAFEQIASIDLKKEEQGILSLSQDWQIPFVTYTEEELKQVPGEFTPSPFVKKITGVDNVCERSAVLASGNGRLLQRKTGENGVTTAVAAREWRIHFE